MTWRNVSNNDASIRTCIQYMTSVYFKLYKCIGVGIMNDVILFYYCEAKYHDNHDYCFHSIFTEN